MVKSCFLRLNPLCKCVREIYYDYTPVRNHVLTNEKSDHLLMLGLRASSFSASSVSSVFDSFSSCLVWLPGSWLSGVGDFSSGIRSARSWEDPFRFDGFRSSVPSEPPDGDTSSQTSNAAESTFSVFVALIALEDTGIGVVESHGLSSLSVLTDVSPSVTVFFKWTRSFSPPVLWLWLLLTLLSLVFLLLEASEHRGNNHNKPKNWTKLQSVVTPPAVLPFLALSFFFLSSLGSVPICV